MSVKYVTYGGMSYENFCSSGVWLMVWLMEGKKISRGMNNGSHLIAILVRKAVAHEGLEYNGR